MDFGKFLEGYFVLRKLRIWRADHGLSQAKLARDIGINPTEFSLIEQSRLRPSQRQLELFRAYFGEQADALLSEATLSTDAAI